MIGSLCFSRSVPFLLKGRLLFSFRIFNLLFIHTQVSTMQTPRAPTTDMVETQPQKKDIDGLSNAAAVQIFSGLSCIALQVGYVKTKEKITVILPRRQHLQSTPFRCCVVLQQSVVYSYTVRNIQFALQVFLLVNYHDASESIQHNGNTIFTLAVGSFGFLAGIFGCFANASRKWFK